MSITHTNHKGLTFYLCKGVTKTGKPRYYFAREPKDKAVEQVPAGFTISESVNGVVSLTKVKPMLILPAELAVIEAAVRRHPKSHNYRVSAKHDEIQVYERTGADPADVIRVLQENEFFRSLVEQQRLSDQIYDEFERNGHFTPVLCFILTNEVQRTFCAQRLHYRGSGNEWFWIGQGSIAELAQQWIPRLGTNTFFEFD